MSDEETDRIIEMAWEDRTPFEAIESQFGLNEEAVIAVMRRQLSTGSFKRWRKRVRGRPTKHRIKRGFTTGPFKSSRQRQVSQNRIAKR